jgi:hypothetical protein
MYSSDSLSLLSSSDVCVYKYFQLLWTWMIKFTTFTRPQTECNLKLLYGCVEEKRKVLSSAAARKVPLQFTATYIVSRGLWHLSKPLRWWKLSTWKLLPASKHPNLALNDCKKEHICNSWHEIKLFLNSFTHGMMPKCKREWVPDLSPHSWNWGLEWTGRGSSTTEL